MYVHKEKSILMSQRRMGKKDRVSAVSFRNKRKLTRNDYTKRLQKEDYFEE